MIKVVFGDVHICGNIDIDKSIDTKYKKINTCKNSNISKDAEALIYKEIEQLIYIESVIDIKVLIYK